MGVSVSVTYTLHLTLFEWSHKYQYLIFTHPPCPLLIPRLSSHCTLPYLSHRKVRMQCRKLALMRQMQINMNQKDKDEERAERAYLSESQG